MAGQGWGHILAAGVDGYLRGQGIVQAQDERKADREFQAEQRTRQRGEWADKDALKTELRAAAAPVQVVEGAGDAVLPQTMDNRDVGQPGEAPLTPGQPYRVGAQTFGEQAPAIAAAAAQNDPAAVAGRQAAAYTSRSMPAEAAMLEKRQADLQKVASELKEKKVFDAVRKFRAGDQTAAVQGLRDSGLYNIPKDAAVQMEPREIELPGVGKIKSYDLKFNQVGEDGKEVPVVVNSHFASMAILPYEKQLELQGKGLDREDRALDRQEKRDTSKVLAASLVALRSAQADRADRSGGGSGGAAGTAKADRETRLTLQNMSGNVSREIREIDAALKEETKDAIPGRPPSARAQELVKQRADLQGRRNELNEEMSALPRSTSGIAAQRATQKPKTFKSEKNGDIPVVTSPEQYAKVPSGSWYLHPDGQETKKK